MVALGRSFPLLVTIVCVTACTSATHRGQTLYVEGRLIEAAEVFEHGESHLTEIGNKDRVRYGLYRGATLLKLGDLDGASRWLYFAQQAENHSPGSLEVSDVLMLRLAFKDLDRRRALIRPAVNPLTGAMASAADGTKPLAPDVETPVEAHPAVAPTSAMQAEPKAPKYRR